MTTTPRLRDDDPIPPGIIRRVSLGVIVGINCLSLLSILRTYDVTSVRFSRHFVAPLREQQVAILWRLSRRAGQPTGRERKSVVRNNTLTHTQQLYLLTQQATNHGNPKSNRHRLSPLSDHGSRPPRTDLCVASDRTAFEGQCRDRQRRRRHSDRVHVAVLVLRLDAPVASAHQADL